MSPPGISSLIGGYPPPSSPDTFPDHLREQLKEPNPLFDIDKVKDFPIVKEQARIMDMIINNDEFVLIGETGSGKTTAMPIMLNEYRKVAEAEGLLQPGKIAVTQPRRVAATETSEWIAKIAQTTLGDKVGYHVKDDHMYSPDTEIMVMTEGILLAKMKSDPLLEEYSIIMIDEAHERSSDIDLLIGLIRNVNETRRNQGKPVIKLAVTSATIEQKKFTDYFHKEGQKYKNYENVKGNLYPIKETYMDEDPEDFTLAAANKVIEILSQKRPIPKSGKPEDMLIFMPGKGEIDQTIAHIKREIEKKFGKGTSDLFDIMPLHGEMTKDEQKNAMRENVMGPNGRLKRKIIVSTNVAETSLTIDGIRHVIDSGLIRQIMFDKETGIESLELVKHARAGLTQRKGRAGRKEPGEYHALYSLESKNSKDREEYQVPEVLRKDPAKLILTMKLLGIHDIENFKFIDPIPPESIAEATHKLKILGALDQYGNITREGKLISELGVKPEYGRMILEAQKLGCERAMCDIIALLSAKLPFKPYSITGDEEADKKGKLAVRTKHYRLRTANNNINSDFLGILYLMEAFDKAPTLPEYQHPPDSFDKNKPWDDMAKRRQWAYDNHLSMGPFITAARSRAEYLQILAKGGITYQNNASGDLSERIQKSVFAGSLHKLFIRSSKPNEPTDRNAYYEEIFPRSKQKQDKVKIDNSSAISNVPAGKVLIIDQIRLSKDKKDAYGQMCQVVNPVWFEEMAPHLCEVVLITRKGPVNSVVIEQIRLKGTDIVVRKVQESVIPTRDLNKTIKEAQLRVQQRQQQIAQSRQTSSQTNNSANTVQNKPWYKKYFK